MAPRIQGEGIFFCGYLWWLGRSLINGRDLRWVAGLGNGGQRVYVVPDADLVVATFEGQLRRDADGRQGPLAN